MVVLLSGVMGYVLYTIRDVPDPGQVPLLSRSIVINDRKNRQIEQSNAQGQYYQKLDLDQMGSSNQWATLAAEDRDFYNHSAIDFTATARAAGADLLHRGNLQGGSTITQQLVKISVLTPQRSIFRKMQEATIAFTLESRYKKADILAMYLNRVFYGHNAYGIGAATRVYFGSGKNASDLSIGQAAFLAGLINGPSFYDPQLYYDRAKQRQLYVLDGMVKMGKISQAQADQAAQENIQAELKFDATLIRSLAPHFTNYVLIQAERLLPAADIQAGGFTIDTTLDLDLQAQAQRAVSDGVANARLKRQGVNNGDLLAANPSTGEILAWVGSADYYNDAIGGQFDVVSRGLRQPGSSFKPYVFEAALRAHKITLASTLQDVPTDFGGGYKPGDYDNRFEGPISARQALLQSRNVPAVETAQMVGIDQVIKQAQAQGIQTPLKPELATSIGGSEVTMLEHLQGYQAFANQGTLVPLITITRITDAQGNVLYQRQPGTQPGITRVMTPAESYLITDVLKDYPGYWKLGWKRQMAGKSGTTGGSATGVHRDAWMMAYSPDLVVGAWAGNTAPNTVNGGAGTSISAFGVDVGSIVLAPFLNGLPASMNAWYRQPDGLARGSGCPGDHTNGGELFLAGTQGGVNCPTPSPTPTPTATPVPTPTPTATATPTPLPHPSPSPSGHLPPSPLPPLPTP